MNLFLLFILFTCIHPLKGSDSYPYTSTIDPRILENPYTNQDPYFYGPNVLEDLIREEEKNAKSSSSTRTPNFQKTVESSWCTLL